MIEREKEIIDGVVEIIRKYCNPSRIILFGSRAKENNQDNSDFDFAIDDKKPSIIIQRQINNEVESISGLYKVDIVYMEAVDIGFKDIIQKTGEVIYERRT